MSSIRMAAFNSRTRSFMITRPSWEGDSLLVPDAPDSFFLKLFGSGGHMTWTPTFEDIQAMDWRIV